MKQLILFFWTSLLLFRGYPQGAPDSSTTKNNQTYRSSATRVNDLRHTRLEIRFDYENAYAYGKEWITLHPHFYPVDSLCLDAKGMDIYKVGILRGGEVLPLKYSYDNKILTIRLNRVYTSRENYIVKIEYKAKPNELKSEGVAATVNKGMYFINPTKQEKDKPTQIWTQGEPESTSAWCPTIDQPNQRSTVEMFITVPGKYATLSNGILKSSKGNPDGTRTDYWDMDFPHAPYLFFICVGEYAIIRDTWHHKEVKYYVEKKYADLAKRIFGCTPEMMDFFSEITGIPYPWQKYAQVAVRDYLTGGMENTTAALFKESAQQDARELTDGNMVENLIAHELFHQWFGDYVTPESWSNLTLSESFAVLGEELWFDHKYGCDKGDELGYGYMLQYLYSEKDKQRLVSYYYDGPDDMFNVVTYDKGAAILKMLMNYVGDSAFFRSLHRFLSDNKYRPVEVADLRLAFEEVTGMDLNWFFNQWYFGAGHPKVEINYDYNDSLGKVKVMVKQVQGGEQVFRLPFNIDVYGDTGRERYPVIMDKQEQVFTFSYKYRPKWINVDGDKVMLWAKNDNKSLNDYIIQYANGRNYVDKREAINAVAAHQDDSAAIAMLLTALHDRFEGLRFLTLMFLDLEKPQVKKMIEPVIASMADNESSSRIKARIVELLSEYDSPKYLSFFRKSLDDSSYTVAGEALKALSKFDSSSALLKAEQLRNKEIKGRLSDVVTGILMTKGSGEDFDFFADKFDRLPMSEYKLGMLQQFADNLGKINNTGRLKKGVDIIVRFRDAIPPPYNRETDNMIDNFVLKGIADKKRGGPGAVQDPEREEQIRYINSKMGH